MSSETTLLTNLLSEVLIRKCKPCGGPGRPLYRHGARMSSYPRLIILARLIATGGRQTTFLVEIWRYSRLVLFSRR